jgi:hypothetical protein
MLKERLKEIFVIADSNEARVDLRTPTIRPILLGLLRVASSCSLLIVDELSTMCVDSRLRLSLAHDAEGRRSELKTPSWETSFAIVMTFGETF